MKWCMLALAMTACGTTRTEAAPREHAPSIELHPVEELCATKGDVAGGAVREPTVRAYARGATGDAAQLTFTFNGDADTARALASGELRRQMGLKLRAQNFITHAVKNTFRLYTRMRERQLVFNT